MLVNKIANAYRSARGKEKVAYSNFRRGVEVPLAPEQTNSQIFENIKNVYDDIGIDTPLPKANIVPYDETFARNQTQNSEFIKGNGFIMDKKGKLEYTDRIIYELGEYLKQNVDLNKNPVTASLNFLQAHHPEMFANRKEAHDTLKKIYNSIPEIIQKRDNGEHYIAKSFIERPSNAKSLMADAIIKPLENENYTKHLNLKAYNKWMREAMESGRNVPPPTHQSELARALGSDNSPVLDSRSLSKVDSIIPSQNLKAPITTDDIFKEAINLHRSGFKFDKDINENINIVLNKIKNDRLNTTSAKNAQVPNNELLPPPKEPMHNPNWYDEFVKNKPANMDMNYLKKYYDVDGFLNDRAGVLAKDIRYNNRQIEPSKIIDNQGHGGWEYKRTRQITEPNYNADFQITKADVNAIKNGTASSQTIQKLADDLEASKHLGYGYDNFSKNVDNYLTSLEKRGVKPELVNSLRQKLVNEPELFTPQSIKETEEFIKNNPNLVLKNPKKEPLSQDEFYLNRANKYIDELEQKGLKPEYVAKLRNNALENPHRFSDEAIEKNEWFMKNNYDTLFNKQSKAPKNEPISKKLTDDATYDFKSENIFTDLRKNKIGDLNRHPKVFEALKNLDEANARAEFKLKNFNNETFLQEKARLNADFLSKDDVKKILQSEIEFRISNLEAIDKFYNMHPKALNKKELLKMADELENINKDLDDILNANIVKPILNSAKRKLDQSVYDIKITDNPIQKNKYRQILENRLNITPIKEFGKNYAEFYHDPKGAINKLLAEKQGQVAGAFYRKDLGDIDLVWGDIKIGLRKILDKHIDDFSEFGNDINAVGKALDTIISKGKLTTNAGVHTIVFKTEKGTYRVGLGKGWFNKGDNNWVITAYKLDKPSGSVSRPSSQVVKGDGTDLRPNGLSNADNIPQNTLNNDKMPKVLYEDYIPQPKRFNDAKSEYPALRDDEVRQVAYTYEYDRPFYEKIKNVAKKLSDDRLKKEYLNRELLSPEQSQKLIESQRVRFRNKRLTPKGIIKKLNNEIDKSLAEFNEISTLIKQPHKRMKGGFITQAMAKNIVAGGIGGGIGAYSAPNDKKLEGFIIGALGGMGASNFGGISHSAVNLVKNMIKTPKGIDKAIEKGVDKGLVGVANKFLSKEAAKTWSDIGGNVGNIKYFFTNTLDKSYEKVRDSVTSELNAMFNKYVNLSSVLNQLSKQDNKAFYDFLANNGSIENLSPEIRKFANDVRNQIIKEFEYQMGAKLVDENTAKEFSGNFLSRIYENEGLKSKFKDWISSSSSAFGIDPIYKRGLEKTIGIGEYQRLKALGKIAVKGDKGFSTGGKWILNEPYDEKTLLKMADEISLIIKHFDA
ncbi:hypothetical protein O6B42_02425 [Campylobacter ureolyticus]|uniref:putative barnase/colicin E5 family endoribonuclease n=3 Tax=Campylobacter ureolyticus TaxID=827 RepID=UPI0022B4E04A|nr:hypothetical protein [Campylobacter ureolyticus]MCZ6132739.1 hypothetical protein [Campylobacter ureolyticus]